MSITRILILSFSLVLINFGLKAENLSTGISDTTQANTSLQFEVFPGGAPSDIQVSAQQGYELISIEEGKLIIRKGEQEFTAQVPFAYQENPDGSRIEVKVGYQINENGQVSFHTSEYELAQTLVIEISTPKAEGGNNILETEIFSDFVMPMTMPL